MLVLETKLKIWKGLLRPAPLIFPPGRFLSLSAPGSKKVCEQLKTGSTAGELAGPQEAAGLFTCRSDVRETELFTQHPLSRRDSEKAEMSSKSQNVHGEKKLWIIRSQVKY